MNAIYGAYAFNASAIDTEAAARMPLPMRHRGGDHAGAYTGTDVCLGSLQKWVLAEDHGETQPLADGEVRLVGSVRLDNRTDLIRKFSLDASVSDAAIVLAAYRTYAAGFVEHIVGDFAVAVWDGSERRLICARDHFGAKPFYYWNDGKTFLFGTEIKAIIAYLGTKPPIDQVRLFEYLAGLSRDDREITIFKDVRRLPPGHMMTVDHNGASLREYYRLELPPLTERASEAEYVEEFRGLFTESVRNRMRTSGRAGSELSGGLDSSYVTCMARDLQPDEPWHVVSNVFDTFGEADEREYMDHVVSQGGVVSHRVVSDNLGPLSILDDVFSVLDDPYPAGNHHMVWQGYQTAAAAGIDVLLDGFDGDTVVGHGPEVFRKLAHENDWAGLWRELDAAAHNMKNDHHRQHLQEQLADPKILLHANVVRTLGRYAEEGRVREYFKATRSLRRTLGVNTMGLHRRFWKRLVAPSFLLEYRNRRKKKKDGYLWYVDSDFLSEPAIQDRINAHRNIPATLIHRTDREPQRNTIASDVYPRSMEIMDHYAAFWGVEVRHPYMDKRLVEYCLSLPLELSFTNGWARYIMRQAMDGTVPEAIRWRSGKADLTPAFDHGLFSVDRGVVDDFLSNPGQASQFIDTEALKSGYARGSELDAKEAWQVAMVVAVGRWLREH